MKKNRDLHLSLISVYDNALFSTVRHNRFKVHTSTSRSDNFELYFNEEFVDEEKKKEKE